MVQESSLQSSFWMSPQELWKFLTKVVIVCVWLAAKIIKEKLKWKLFFSLSGKSNNGSVKQHSAVLQWCDQRSEPSPLHLLTAHLALLQCFCTEVTNCGWHRETLAPKDEQIRGNHILRLISLWLTFACPFGVLSISFKFGKGQAALTATLTLSSSAVVYA